jgi:hypothetical protein
MMGQIFVQPGAMVVAKVPKDYQDTASGALKDAVADAVKKDKGLTDKKGEGYTILLTVSEMTVDAKGVSCKLKGEIERYPKREMLSTSIKNGASANGGKPDELAKQCVGSAAEDMMKKIIPVLKKQARP